MDGSNRKRGHDGFSIIPPTKKQRTVQPEPSIIVIDDDAIIANSHLARQLTATRKPVFTEFANHASHPTGDFKKLKQDAVASPSRGTVSPQTTNVYYDDPKEFDIALDRILGPDYPAAGPFVLPELPGSPAASNEDLATFGRDNTEKATIRNVSQPNINNRIREQHPVTEITKETQDMRDNYTTERHVQVHLVQPMTLEELLEASDDDYLNYLKYLEGPVFDNKDQNHIHIESQCVTQKPLVPTLSQDMAQQQTNDMIEQRSRKEQEAIHIEPTGPKQIANKRVGTDQEKAKNIDTQPQTQDKAERANDIEAQFNAEENAMKKQAKARKPKQLRQEEKTSMHQAEAAYQNKVNSLEYIYQYNTCAQQQLLPKPTMRQPAALNQATPRTSRPRTAHHRVSQTPKSLQDLANQQYEINMQIRDLDNDLELEELERAYRDLDERKKARRRMQDKRRRLQKKLENLTTQSAPSKPGSTQASMATSRLSTPVQVPCHTQGPCQQPDNQRPTMNPLAQPLNQQLEHLGQEMRHFQYIEQMAVTFSHLHGREPTGFEVTEMVKRVYDGRGI